MSASSVSVSFPELGAREERPRGVRVIREEYRHDIAIYETTLERRSYPYRSGTPVRIDWSQGRHSSQFSGYVHHIEPFGDDRATVWCRAASSALDNGIQANFRFRSVPSVVAEVARSINFDASITPHGRVFDSIASTGGRVWDLLRDNAMEIGYSFYCIDTRVMLHPRLETVRRFTAEAPLLLSTPNGGGSLMDFVPVDGHEGTGRRRANRVATGLDPQTGASFEVVGGVVGTELGRTMSLPTGVTYENLGSVTPSDARWKLAAMAENDRFNVTASATAFGDPRVHQTWPVIIGGIGERYEGLWFVRKVTHNLSDPTYTMSLELGKDGHGSTVAIPEPQARRVVATRNNPQGRPKAVFPPSVLSGGQWRAQWSASSRTFAETSTRVLA